MDTAMFEAPPGPALRARPRPVLPHPFREVRRAWEALRHGSDPPITRTRAVMQVVLTALLLPVCLWVLFGAADTGSTAHEAASALLGAVVAFWLKD